MEGVSRAAGVAVDSLSNSYVSQTYATTICPNILSQREKPSASYAGEIRRDLQRLANQLHNEKVTQFDTSGYVNIEEFLPPPEHHQSNSSIVYQSIIANNPSANSDHENEQSLLNYMGQTDANSANSGCLVQLEPVDQDHLESAAFSTAPFASLPSDSLSYVNTALEQKLGLGFEDSHFLATSSPSEDMSSTDRPTAVARNVTAVPVQIVRPQQHKSNNVTISTTTDDDSPISTSSSRSPPKMRPSRKRGARTASLGSSSDEGSLLNASSNSEGGDLGLDGDASKHRKMKQPVPDAKKDEKYWRRRLKNNLAAKRSREARKQKENQTSVRAAFLEEQHSALRRAPEEARQQNEELRKRLSRYESLDHLPKIGFVLSPDKIK